MKNVINIDAKQVRGNFGFTFCGCDKSDPQPFSVICLYESNPIVAALICEKCGKVVPVENGIVKFR